MSDGEQLIPSAVCVPLLIRDGHPHLLLTKRSMDVSVHKGQICFPGGMWEEADGDLLNTALREIEEELGISRTLIQVIGPLESTTTPTGFHISPFVVLVNSQCEFKPSKEEIERLLFVPLHDLTATRIPETAPEYHWDGELIWGATARIITQLLRLTLH